MLGHLGSTHSRLLMGNFRAKHVLLLLKTSIYIFGASLQSLGASKSVKSLFLRKRKKKLRKSWGIIVFRADIGTWGWKTFILGPPTPKLCIYALYIYNIHIIHLDLLICQEGECTVWFSQRIKNPEDQPYLRTHFFFYAMDTHNGGCQH